jgi:hypothetical protein
MNHQYLHGDNKSHYHTQALIHPYNNKKLLPLFLCGVEISQKEIKIRKIEGQRRSEDVGQGLGCQ